MTLYEQVSQETAEAVTKAYSTSFSAATRLFPPSMRRHIYNIYGLVRIADEIVDTYKGPGAAEMLDQLETETFEAIQRGYSSNLIVQAFGLTAREFKNDATLISPFFTSMRTDLSKRTFSKQEYKKYIYGSAEVIGLMCLKVFTTDNRQYQRLAPGAQALGAAFQKINFLRDFADDAQRLGRCYFPDTSYSSFDNKAKQAIIKDIHSDLTKAKKAIDLLPRDAQPAVKLAYNYYGKLLTKLEAQSVDQIKQTRLSVPNWMKAALYAQIRVKQGLQRG